MAKRLPETPEYDMMYNLKPGTMLIHGDKLPHSYIFILEGKLRAEVLADRMYLWVYGIVEWLDYLGEQHETRFCNQALRMHPDADEWFAFVHAGDTPPAYTKRT